jgi:MarR family transcriptional regulator, temperature-dependent positive regulator of motility
MPKRTRNAPFDLSLMHLLHRGSQHAEEVFSLSIGNSDITPRQYEILSAVAKNDGVNQTDIVNATGIDRSTTAELVKRLVKKGWLQRRRAKDDARAYAVRLTAAGKKAMKIGEAACLEADEKVLAGLSSAQRAQLIKALGAIIQELGSPT